MIAKAQVADLVDKALAFPNPTSGKVTLKLNNEAATSLDVNIVSTEGRVVRRVKEAQISAFHEQEFNLSDLPTGIYTIQLKIGEERQLQRIILAK